MEDRKPERRIGERFELRWRVALSTPRGTWIESVTENISSRGFYCVSPLPLLPGTRTQCRIAIPGPGRRQSERWMHLTCGVKITRTVKITSGYGLGCYIETYTVRSYP